jgi:hypothetical protein
MTTVAFWKEEYFSLDMDETTGRYFLSIPVGNGLCDYSEWYELDQQTFEQYRLDLTSALPFVEQCREHLHDDLLLLKPGRDRGTPWRPRAK